MTFIKINEENIIYPYTVNQLKRDNPNISFPEDLSQISLSDINVYPVSEAAKPAASENEQIVEVTPELIDNVWTQTWIVEPVPVYVPKSVDMAQARIALIMAGIPISTIDSKIAEIEDPLEREIAQTEWEYRTTVRRDSPLVTSLGPALGLTDEQIDALFISASKL